MTKRGQMLLNALVNVLINNNYWVASLTFRALLKLWFADLQKEQCVSLSWECWAGRAGPKSFNCGTTQLIFVCVNPIFASGYLVLPVCSLHVEPSPWTLLHPSGECSHCCPWFGEFKDPQCSERRCRTISMCSQEQPGHSLFKTCNSGSGRWVTLALGSSSTCQVLVYTWLTWIHLALSHRCWQKHLRRWPKRQKKGKERKAEWETERVCPYLLPLLTDGERNDLWRVIVHGWCGSGGIFVSQMCFSFWWMVSKMPACFLLEKSHQTHGLCTMACEGG